VARLGRAIAAAAATVAIATSTMPMAAAVAVATSTMPMASMVWEWGASATCAL
jgi:hypothetical protein